MSEQQTGGLPENGCKEGSPYPQHISGRMQDITLLPRLILELTSVCQVRCVWCLMQTFKKIPKQHMPFDRFARFMEQNGEYLRRNKTAITPFSRGEPLIHPRFWDCCAIMRENGLALDSIATNLSMKISVDDFLANPIDYIVVNLGGVTREVHEAVMINSNFKLVVKNLRELWSAGVPVRVKINPCRANIHQLALLPSFVERLGGKREYVERYTTYFPHPDDITEEERDFFLANVYSPEHKHLFRFIMDSAGEVIQTRKDCPANLMVDTVFANGNYAICCHDHHEQSIVGNVFETPLEELRASEPYRNTYWRGLKRELVNCRYCA